MARNSLQAVLERQIEREPTTEPPSRAPEPEAKKFSRPSRDGRRFLGGHFDPKVIKQVKILAAEEDTTTQALLEEALDLLFIKKGKAAIARQ